MKSNHRNLLAFVAVVALGVLVARRFVARPADGALPSLADDVERCKAHQRALYPALVEAARANGGRLPALGTAELLGRLVPDGFLEDTPANRAALACPGPGVPAGEGAGRGYVLRDFAAHPLERFPTGGDEPVLACDDAGGANHPSGAVNVLFADGSVHTFVLASLQADGTLASDAAAIPVGTDSPVPLLRVFPGPR